VTATPPRADLRTLATLAAHDVDCPGGARCHEDLTTDGRYGRYADAVLAAVLPEHRRVVLAEAAEALQHRADNVPWSDPTIGRGIRYAHSVVVMLARESAAAAPPAGLSAPVPAENAPAVPEEADGQRVAEGDALTYAEMEAERDRLARELTVAEEHSADVIGRLVADRDRLAAQVAHYQRLVGQVRALHTALDGRCVECVEYCDCLDRVIDLGGDVEVAASARMCNHGNEPWPCPTIAAVDALSDAGTDQTEDETDVHL
jgi:hypothetical protein